jgi:hypothetical protein
VVNRNLMRTFDLPADQLADQLGAIFGEDGDWLTPDAQVIRENRLLSGRVLQVTADVVVVDIGYKRASTVSCTSAT